MKVWRLTIENNKTISDQLASYLYKLEEVKHVETNESQLEQKPSPVFSILFINAGRGAIEFANRNYTLEKEKVFIIPPEIPIKFHLQSNSTFDYYYINFIALQETYNKTHTPVNLDFPNELTIKHPSFLHNMFSKIETSYLSENNWDVMKANILFQEMLSFIFRTAFQEVTCADEQILLTKDYMEQNYWLNITREELAKMARMSPDYYSRTFKKRVGKTPMEYLSEIRIRNAKKSLILSEETSRTIAQKVGFKDEFYFSRKFKVVTGFSPRVYVNKFKQTAKIVSLKHLSTGHLLSLGIEPYAAVINRVYPITTQFQNTIAVGGLEPDLEKIMRASPDLIINRESGNKEVSHKEKMYEQIATTVTLPFYKSWREHLKDISKVVGKEEKANSWLERYDSKAEAIQKQIKNKIGDETVLVVGVGDGEICVYGQRNIGSVLYEDLKVSMPKGVKNIAHTLRVSLEDLCEFEADRIILTTRDHNGTRQMDNVISNEIARLFANKKWNTLKAVKNKLVYCMYDNQHLYTCYTSHSHYLLLDKINEMLVSDLYK